MMRIGITGGYGFIGWHLRCYLATRTDVAEIRVADRAVFADAARLRDFVRDLDLIVHLAGVNRAPDGVLRAENIALADVLIGALRAEDHAPCLIYASSTQAAARQTAYGHGKAIAAEHLAAWAQAAGARFIELIVPHVFGEYGRPHYNSAVATFCHQIAHGQAPSITGDGLLTLVHAQDLVERMITLHLDAAVGKIAIDGEPARVGEVAARLQSMYVDYMEQGVLPDLRAAFDRNLFNTLRAALPADLRLRNATPHADTRGWLAEAIKARSEGQCFVSSTRPGVTRGNHYHRRKVERFFVLQGRARIRLRRLFTDEVLAYELDGQTPAYVDMPTLCTHDITNTGDQELLTLFWADEIFDPAKPDTFAENVDEA